MYEWGRSDKLIKILRKLYKKDKNKFEATLKKIREVAYNNNPQHYKNLSHSLKDFNRVHIDSHFVLIFKVDENYKLIKFVDLQHQDTIYKIK